jgi:hypothetical protein
MTAFVLFIVSIVCNVAMAILNGWVLTYLWEWFVIPTIKFMSVDVATAYLVPPISVMQGIGIMMIVGFLSLNMNSVKLDEIHKKIVGKDEDVTDIAMTGICNSFGMAIAGLVALGIGYIYHSFM